MDSKYEWDNPRDKGALNQGYSRSVLSKAPIGRVVPYSLWLGFRDGHYAIAIRRMILEVAMVGAGGMAAVSQLSSRCSGTVLLGRSITGIIIK